MKASTHAGLSRAGAVPPVIEARGVEVTISGHPILKGVDLLIPGGQVVALIGPNGSGKTTLLRALLGLQSVDRGQILLFGQPLDRRVLRRVAYVPQKLAMESGFALSVREFLALASDRALHWFWKSHAALDKLLMPAVEEVQIVDLLDRPLAKLSGGQFQRVMVAFALLRNPDLLLLDEPTAGVDAPGEYTFYELIGELQRRRGLTVVLVSHDLSMVYRHSTMVYALNGVICCEGKPEDVMNADSLKRAYGIHVAPYQHHHHHGHGHSHPHVE